MLLAEDSSIARAALLLSYPLHPPKQPEKLRTAHWPSLRTPCLFVHGTADPFASVSELTDAMQMIPARHSLSEIHGAGHELNRGKLDINAQVLQPLQGILEA